ncbi:hypothetical protein CGCS363_v015050 [Colletotrichum siamense]|uniref:uncharacterized protein n=1 Tax=Colletotrichum siamense TaxID=690259 RepID=UPI0018723BA7|nr:uncharacterized protein CGCS363_v015050 [Colletotrichum siamense]KAF5483043.1 hypothetical protein CGCS363_v015050 [Colletotrichum siamense]
MLFFSDELGEAVTALEVAVTEVVNVVLLRHAILALEYFPVRVIRQSTRCASRRQTAKKKVRREERLSTSTSHGSAALATPNTLTQFSHWLWPQALGEDLRAAAQARIASVKYVRT